MEDNFDLQPIADSLYASGFFPEEPLVAVNEKLPETRRIETVVVEGNRRLAALRSVLSKPDKYPDAKKRNALANVPVILRPTRDELLPFLGFRHITGVKGWGSAQMARYAVSLVEAGKSIDEICHLIGDTTQKIRRLIRTESLAQEAAKQDLTPEDTAKGFFFSYLLTATDSSATQKYLRLKLDEKKGTVKQVDREHLAQLWQWLYGSQNLGTTPVIPESRYIGRLSAVLGDEKARTELIQTGDLSKAHALTIPREQYIAETLGEIRAKLQDLAGVVIAEAGEIKVTTAIKDEFERACSEVVKVHKLLEQIRKTLKL
jgi:hypothetical protein